MIDVQARIRSTGRCFVAPEDYIVAVTFAVADDDSYCGRRYFARSGFYVCDWKGNMSRQTEEQGLRWVSTDGEILFWWMLDTLYRDHGRERHGPSKWERENDNWAGKPGWIPNYFHRLECAAYLLDLEEVKRYGAQGLDFNPHTGKWEKSKRPS